jgi:hypothetical protein
MAMRQTAARTMARSAAAAERRLVVAVQRAAVQTDAAIHPQNANAFLRSDVYRLSVTGDAGYNAALANELVAIPFGAEGPVRVYVTRGAGAPPAGAVTLNAVSESDPTKLATARCTVPR